MAEKYHPSEKVEYFAVRNGVGVFDTSPLYKYRITGRDAEPYLAGLLARDPGACESGRAQYQLWCDDRGFVLEDGVLIRSDPEQWLLTTARPNLSYLLGMVGGREVQIEDHTDLIGAMAVQGPRSKAVLTSIAPEVGGLGFFDVARLRFGDVPVTVSRTGFTGDLGYEVWVDAGDAVTVWDQVFEAGAPHGIVPFGQIALLMTRIEAGLLLIDVDFESSKRAYNDAHRATPFELGLGWMLSDLEEDRPFVGRNALRKLRSDGAARWKTIGVLVDPLAYAATYEGAGLIPPKNHLPVHEESMLYDEGGQRVGFVTSAMYSPVLQRHIAIARIEPHLAIPDTPVQLEFTIDHRYHLVGGRVARLPMFNPDRKTA